MVSFVFVKKFLTNIHRLTKKYFRHIVYLPNFSSPKMFSYYVSVSEQLNQQVLCHQASIPPVVMPKLSTFIRNTSDLFSMFLFGYISVTIYMHVSLFKGYSYRHVAV